MAGESSDIQIPGPLGHIIRGSGAVTERMRAAGRSIGPWLGALVRRPKFRLIAAGVVLLLPIPLYCVWAFLNQLSPPAASLEAALAALDRGELHAACSQASRLLEAESFDPWNHGGPAFVLGIAATCRANMKSGQARRDQQVLAARYLGEARLLGLPTGRQAQGHHHLGQVLIELGRPAESIDVLNEALRASRQAGDKHRVAEVHKLLASAYRRLPEPDFARALDHHGQYLRGPLSPGRRQAGLLEQGRMQLALGQVDACRETLGQVSGDASQVRWAQILRAQLLMFEARRLEQETPAAADIQQNYHEAISLLKAARGRDTLRQDSLPAAVYLLGLCYERTGDRVAALAALREVQGRSGDPHLELAAKLRHAEMLQQRDQPAAAEALYQAVAQLAGNPNNDDNPWITPPEVRSRLMAARNRFLETEEFDRAVRLVGRFVALLSPEKQALLLAETNQSCGERMEAKATSANPGQAELLRTRMRQFFRGAGKAYYLLARLRKATKHYTSDLWSSIESYLAAGDSQHAEPLLRAYLSMDLPAGDHPKALVRMAQCQLAGGKPRAALATLKVCFDQFPRDPFVYEGRLLAARAHLRQNEPEGAEAMLRANLDGGELAPASPEWRDSLFALGRVRHLRGRWSEAITTLDEAVQRYPASEQTPRARYLLAESYRQRAREHGKKSDSSIEDEREFHATRQREDFAAAVAGLNEAIRDLRREGAARTALADSTLRNALFALGTTLYEVGRYEEAVRAYASVVNRYPHEPAVLEAYVQISTALRELHRPDEAHNAILQARAVLENMPEKTSFAATTKTSRQAWKSYLDWLARP